MTLKEQIAENHPHEPNAEAIIEEVVSDYVLPYLQQRVKIKEEEKQKAYIGIIDSDFNPVKRARFEGMHDQAEGAILELELAIKYFSL